MRKTKLLNSEVSYVISKMGHFDTLVIGDAGLPVPDSVKRIDLAVTLGIPSFRDVFYAVMEELKIQKAIIASEMKDKNPVLYTELIAFFAGEGVVVEEVPHEHFKELTMESKAIVRTGETKPYANVIIESNVVF